MPVAFVYSADGKYFCHYQNGDCDDKLDSCFHNQSTVRMESLFRMILMSDF